MTPRRKLSSEADCGDVPKDSHGGPGPSHLAWIAMPAIGWRFPSRLQDDLHLQVVVQGRRPHKKEPSRGVQHEGRVSSLTGLELLGDLHGFLDLFKQVDLRRVGAHVAEDELGGVLGEQASDAGSRGSA